MECLIVAYGRDFEPMSTCPRAGPMCIVAMRCSVLFLTNQKFVVDGGGV